MINRRFGAVLVAAASLVLAASPARADYVVKDGNGAFQTMKSYINSLIHHPGHVLEGLFGGIPTPVNQTNSGALDVTVVGGGAGGGIVTQSTPANLQAQVSTADVRPASSTITAADAATTTTAGQGSVNLVSGTPTANSFQTQAINGQSSATVTTTGTFVATLQIEASYEPSRTIFVPVSGLLRGTNLTTASITAPSMISLDVTSATALRVRDTSYTSGTATVQMAFSAAAGMTKILNGVGLVDRTTGANIDLSPAGSGIGATGAAVPANAGLEACRAATASPTAVTDGQLVAALCGAEGKRIVMPYAIPENATTGLITTAMTGTTSTALTGMGAQGPTLRNYVTEVSCHNTHATVDTLVNIQDGSGGTVLAQLFCAHVGGHQKTFPMPLRQPTLNTGLFAADVTTGASVTVSASGFKAP